MCSACEVTVKVPLEIKNPFNLKGTYTFCLIQSGTDIDRNHITRGTVEDLFRVLTVGENCDILSKNLLEREDGNVELHIEIRL